MSQSQAPSEKKKWVLSTKRLSQSLEKFTEFLKGKKPQTVRRYLTEYKAFREQLGKQIDRETIKKAYRKALGEKVEEETALPPLPEEKAVEEKVEEKKVEEKPQKRKPVFGEVEVYKVRPKKRRMRKKVVKMQTDIEIEKLTAEEVLEQVKDELETLTRHPVEGYEYIGAKAELAVIRISDQGKEVSYPYVTTAMFSPEERWQAVEMLTNKIEKIVMRESVERVHVKSISAVFYGRRLLRRRAAR